MVGFEILTLLTGSVLKPDHKSLSSHFAQVNTAGIFFLLSSKLPVKMK